MTDETNNNATTTTTSSSSSDAGYEYNGFLIFVKVLGLFSMAASSFIIRDVVLKLRSTSATSMGARTGAGGGGSGARFSWRHKVSLTRSVLFCLSLGDFFAAFFVQFLSTWMVPSWVRVSFASGNVTSCTFQGFFSVLFYTLSACSNASLAVAYCLVVKFGWRDDDKYRYRFPFTIIPVVCALILSIIPLPFHAYNYNGGFFCDIAASPLHCDFPESTTPCQRGANARLLLLWVGVVPYMIAFGVIIVSVVMLVHAVLMQERRMDRYRRGGAENSRIMTIQTSSQGLYYIGAFGLAWIPWYVYALIEVQHHRVPEALAVVHYTTMPLQGVFNTLVYFRPKYKSRRERHPLETRISSLAHVLKISLPDVKCCRAGTDPQQHDLNENEEDRCDGGGQKVDEEQVKGGERQGQ